MRALLLIVSTLIGSLCFGQRILKLDTPKDPSRMVFRIGSTISFQIDDEKSNWFTDRIIDFEPERGWIIFETWHVHVNDITAVRRERGGFVRSIPVMLKTFGLGAVFFGTVGRLSKNCQNCNEATIVGAGSFLSGWILGKLLRPKVYKIGDRNKLRLLDLDLTPRPTRV